MLFNSIEFAIFLPIVFAIYWLLKESVRNQNLFLIGASYLFYGWWDARFLGLIILSCTVDFVVARALERQKLPKIRKLLLFVSLATNIGILGFFKYYNFFAESLSDAFTLFGMSIEPNRLNLVLPVGISFYTFQTLSYTIDVYRKKIKANSSPVEFFAYVSFFPQLVAGPIERASTLLPQFTKSRSFNRQTAVDGIRQILWGLFKKMVVADMCASYVDLIFEQPEAHNTATLVLGATLFAFQIYGDFSGYSDIAIGTARLFGFNLMQNFAFPYFSTSIAEFWRRWHISLNTWFRDYVYIPLGGSRGGKLNMARNTVLVFLISGFWHGANWTFIIWGALNAAFFLPLQFANSIKGHSKSTIAVKSKLRKSIGIFTTFSLITFSWIFFRATSFDHAIDYICALLENSTKTPVASWPKATSVMIIFMLILEWLGRRDLHALQTFALDRSRPLRWMFYYALVLMILYFKSPGKEFIYFQF